MSRKGFRWTGRPMPRCGQCGESISHDVARVDGGRIYHLRCFRQQVSEMDLGLYECPKCLTLGRTWDRVGRCWQVCILCAGNGYLAA